MCGPTFYEYMANIFTPLLHENNIPRPVVFFVDGHVSHLTLHVSQFCAENGIILICLVPNSTHITQPMDVAVFRPLKAAWKNSIEVFKSENNLVTIKKEHVGIILKKAVDSMDFGDTITNGFRTCGLFPFTINGINLGKLVCTLKDKGEKLEGGTPQNLKALLPAEVATHLKFIESVLGEEKVFSFKERFGRNVEWARPECDKSLYNFYKNVCNLAIPHDNLDQSTDVDEALAMSVSVPDDQPGTSARNLPCHSTPRMTKDQEEIVKQFNETLPSPFKRSLCWPEVNEKKKKRKIEKIPFVVSSKAYIEYYEKKLKKKE